MNRRHLVLWGELAIIAGVWSLVFLAMTEVVAAAVDRIRFHLGEISLITRSLIFLNDIMAGRWGIAITAFAVLIGVFHLVRICLPRYDRSEAELRLDDRIAEVMVIFGALVLGYIAVALAASLKCICFLC